MSQGVRTRVRSVIAATFGVPLDKVTEETSNHTIENWDSMNHLHLMVALEGEFGTTFEPEDAVALTSVHAIEQALQRAGVA